MARETMDDAPAGVSPGRRRTPEERELDQKSAELAQLESALIQREIELVSVQREMNVFERKYIRTIGVRYSQLDELDSQIAEKMAQRRRAAKAEAARKAPPKAPPQPQAKPQPQAAAKPHRPSPQAGPARNRASTEGAFAAETADPISPQAPAEAPPEQERVHYAPGSTSYEDFARERARVSAEECASVKELGAGEDVMETSARVEASRSLKAIYREVAKQIHPDLTADPIQRARRERLMADANLAYREGDEGALHFILEQWESDPELVPGEGIAVELVRTIRKISQVAARLERIESEINTLLQSDLWALQERLDVPGRHTTLMEELGMRLDEQIAQARKRLASLSRWEKNS